MRREHTIQGGLPSGYMQLEYIECTGTQYIDTCFYPTDKTYFYFDFQITHGTKAAYGVAGVRWTAAPDYMTFGLLDGSDYNYWLYCYYGNAASFSVSLGLNSSNFLNQRHEFVLDGVNKTANIDSSYSTSLPSQNFTANISLPLGRQIYSATSGTSGKIKIYSSIIKDNNIPTRYYIPVLRTSDNKPGLYDLCGSICPLTNTPFYINAGTGEFQYA